MLLTRAGWSERIVKERWQESLLSEPPAMLEPSGEGGPFSTQKLADLLLTISGEFLGRGEASTILLPLGAVC